MASSERSPAHRAYFYAGSDAATSRIAKRTADALSSGGAQILILLPDHLAQVEQQLASSGVDVQALRQSGRYTGLDATVVLEELQVGSAGDESRFVRCVGTLVDGLTEGSSFLQAYGEMVAILAGAGRFDDALRLESFWNAVCRRTGLALECGYWLKDFRADAGSRSLLQVCSVHTSVEPTEEYNDADHEERLRAVTFLQHRAAIATEALEQKARAQQRLRRALDAERAARKAAERALAERDAFLDAAAHELRTPLTAILGSLQLLVRRARRDAGPRGERELLSDAVGQTERMRTLVDGLLNARAAEQKLTIRRRTLEVRPLLQGTIDRYNAILSRERVFLLEGEHLASRVDPKRIDQMLWNLIDNAARYSSPHLPVRVRLEPDDYGLRIVVSDGGPGIPADRRSQVFERYGRAEHEELFEGMGLGLYVCHQIVEAHGGLMSLDCPVDGGTVVTVTLPLGVTGDHRTAGVTSVTSATGT